MNFRNMTPSLRSLVLIAWLVLAAIPAFSQAVASASIRGVVVDSAGALIPDAVVTLTDNAGRNWNQTTKKDGSFVFTRLVIGTYKLTVIAKGFVSFEKSSIALTDSKTVSIDVTLDVMTIDERVTVGDAPPVNTDPDANASAIVLKDKDIAALPDDPAELAAALQALAGPGAGPNGGEIFVDGFSGAKLPPRDTIKEVRLNQNPFSSEYDRMGLGRIEIITKPGSEKWGGEIESQFEDEALNSRNPYARNRPPYQLRAFEGNLTGPLIKDRVSFFLDAEHQAIDNNSLINARTLDPNLNEILVQQGVVTPNRAFEMNPRVDIKVNEKNTLSFRSGFSKDSQDNAGLGGFDLLSRTYNTTSEDHSFRVSHAAVISPTIVNEARFQLYTVRGDQLGGTDSTTIRVNDSFTSGGANVGQSYNKENRFEFANNTSFLFGRNVLKVGGRIRRASVTSVSETNFAGTFTFSSLDQYRDTILNLPGATPSQFSIAGGNPEAKVSVTDWGLFAQNDLKVNPKLTLSFGLRYEDQTGVSDRMNFAPRVSVAFAPGAGVNKTPKTVFRAGFGIFYERFGRNFILQTRRFNGLNQQQYVVTDPAILDSVVFTQSGVSNIPTIETLNAFALPQTTRTIDPNLRIPLVLQTAVSVERQLPWKTTISLSYVNTAVRRQYRSLNANAPRNGIRPDPLAGNIFQYQSNGRYNQDQLIFNFRSNFHESVSIFGNYSFGRSKSDTEGAGSFPAYTYDLSDEYGNSLQDIRHRFTVGGSYSAPLGFRFSPFLSFRSGVPFNITTGIDSNGDTIFNERPAFATNLNRQCDFGTPGSPDIEACVVATRFGSFDRQPIAGQTIIPRNFGRGSNFLGVNLTVAKEFEFVRGGRKKAGEDERTYTLQFSVQARNIFNRTNQGTPVGNLSSLLFGQATSSAGSFGGNGGSSTASNRRIKLIVQLSF